MLKAHLLKQKNLAISYAGKVFTKKSFQTHIRVTQIFGPLHEECLNASPNSQEVLFLHLH